MTLPEFWINNTTLDFEDVCLVVANTVRDLRGANIIGIGTYGAAHVHYRENQVAKLQTRNNTSAGFYTEWASSVAAVYNNVSRTAYGFVMRTVANFGIYNFSSHNNVVGLWTDAPGTLRNAAFSTADGWAGYNTATGITIANSTIALDVDYTYYCHLGDFSVGGIVVAGNNLLEKELWLFDEANDDLVPDHISEAVKSGIANPMRIDPSSIAGTESEISGEITADRKYHYELLDNTFWDIDNDQAPEVGIIKAFQSRILANSELAEQQVERDSFIKSADSAQRWAELYPMHAYYLTQTEYKMAVADMWYASQNCGTVSALNSAIGGYNHLPSFFRRMIDVEEGWVLGESHINYDNWLTGQLAQEYGILIDVLGVSTLSSGASAECFSHVQSSVADLGPSYWLLHDEVEPPRYVVFTPQYHNFEKCTLDNMIYDDDWVIVPDRDHQDSSFTTPLISTSTLGPSGTLTPSASGDVELGWLDRVNSETLTRRIYYRTGPNEANMSAWEEILNPIGAVLTIPLNYIQFRVTVENILRRFDYGFLGLALRAWSINRDWSPYKPHVRTRPWQTIM